MIINTVLFREDFTASLLLLVILLIEDAWMTCIGVNMAWLSHNFTHNRRLWRKKNSTRYGGQEEGSFQDETFR